MNILVLEPTKFENHRSGSLTLGFRIYDDHDQAYDNTWGSIPYYDLDVLNKVIQESCDENILGMLNFIRERCKGLYIAGTWYGHDEIKHLLKE